MGPVNYKVQEIGTTKEEIVHANRLKPYKQREQITHELHFPNLEIKASSSDSEIGYIERNIFSDALSDQPPPAESPSKQSQTSAVTEIPLIETNLIDLDSESEIEDAVEINEENAEQVFSESEHTGHFTCSKGQAPSYPWVLPKRI